MASKKKVIAKKDALTMPVYDIEGKKKKDIAVPKEIFSSKVNEPLVAQYVRVYLANQRKGSAFAKTRGEVTGSTRKIYRQKGTGRARHGAKKAPIFVGGGITFGPRPRDFSLRLNKKQKKQALFSALTMAFKNQNMLALTDESLTVEPKTKKFASFLKKLEIEGKRVLLVLPKGGKTNLLLAVRNIPKLDTTDAASLNAYIVLHKAHVIFLASALEIVKTHFLHKDEN